MLYSDLVLVTLEQSENIAIGFLMVNNLYGPVFDPHHSHLMALF